MPESLRHTIEDALTRNDPRLTLASREPSTVIKCTITDLGYSTRAEARTRQEYQKTGERTVTDSATGMSRSEDEYGYVAINARLTVTCEVKDAETGIALYVERFEPVYSDASDAVAGSRSDDLNAIYVRLAGDAARMILAQFSPRVYSEAVALPSGKLKESSKLLEADSFALIRVIVAASSMNLVTRCDSWQNSPCREIVQPQLTCEEPIMNRRLLQCTTIIPLLVILLPVSPGNATSAPEVHWPTFRGRNASGIAEGFSTPAKWNVPADENVKWKTSIPGLGHSSPIVWGNRLFVTTAVSGQENPKLRVGLYGDIGSVQDDTTHKWIVYCLDKRTGKILWEQVAYTGVPKIKRHPKSTHASCTPATDGEHLLAMFGSEGLYCYNMDGKLLWKKDLGVLDSGYYVVPGAQWEFGSSPIIFQDKVFLQCDIQKGSFVAAFSIKDGRELWRTPREEVPTWSSPTVYQSGNRTLLLVNGYKHIGGYDAATGKEIWRLKGGGDIPVPTPIVAHDLVFITSAHGPMSPIYAIRLGAAGDISLAENTSSNKDVAWSVPRDGAYMITPLVYGDYLYSSKNNGVVSCYEAKTGNRVYQERLGDGTTGFTASPVAADGKLYFSSEDGDIYVVKAGTKFELLAKNSMGEICMATPAISEGTLFFRTQGHVVGIAEKSSRK